MSPGERGAAGGGLRVHFGHSWSGSPSLVQFGSRDPYPVRGVAQTRRQPQDCRTERHKSEAAPHRWLALRYGRNTAIPHARSRTVLGIAPQTAERIRGHMLAAKFWFVARLAFLNGVHRCRVRMPGALCKVP